MKFKKLLAGVLSAALVAASIPAGLAIPGVSAADTTEDGLIASYDLTTEAGRANWTTEGDGITTDTSGVKIPDDSSAKYYISNPFSGKDVSSGITVELTLKVPSGQSFDNYAPIFGFQGTSTSYTGNTGAFFSVNSTGYGVHYNDYYNSNTNSNYYDLTVGNKTCDMSAGVTFALTVKDNTVSVYVDGEPLWIQSAVIIANSDVPHDTLDSDDYIASLTNFVLGYNNPWWTTDSVTVSNVSFYNCLKYTDTPDTCSYDYDLTTAEGRSDWIDYAVTSNGKVYTSGTDKITTGDSGVTITQGAWDQDGQYAYAIKNPLTGQITDGYTVSVKATFTSGAYIDNNCVGLFGFDNHTQWTYHQFSANGALYNNAYNYTLDMYTQTNATTNDNVEHIFTEVVDKTKGTATIYIDGEVLATYTDDTNATTTSYTDGLSASANRNTYFQLGFVAGDYLETSKWAWMNAGATYTDVFFSNKAMTPDEVTATQIAMSLDLTTVGMQKGTYGESNATRFVASLGSSVDTYSDYITHVGWAYQSGLIGTLTSYNTVALEKVTSNSDLLSLISSAGVTTASYAFTAVVAGGSAYSLVPYVEITIDDQQYYYTVSGAAGSYDSESVYEVDKIDSLTLNPAVA